ncbi:cyclic pyranopterin monophosphate synthase MoaC [bacterium CG17_big_fil_post_rev_8_21_14_2_50_64_8]|nr:MAG: cyclic pyranopterin monophosphate synthase MoaC [bacterium CG17_big_fil_post_rev_8_21_14_2_50_64_8]PJA76850.1 MAG: cyclic pyranopterin monophosphate synthase MoaC [bacterium CG_4_9_14_3_um_filter_65_15]
MGFNHFDDKGNAWMVDVSGKQKTLREAQVEAVVHLGCDLLARVVGEGTAKGDVLGTARLAGIAAVKKTADLIPLAHPLALHHASIAFEADSQAGTLRVRCTVKAIERTGVEMEAMTGATVAALTVYDMCKGVKRDITIGPVRLLHKSGGRSGTYQAPEDGS